MLQVDEKNDKCLVKWGTDSETWANTKDVLKGKYSSDQTCSTLHICGRVCNCVCGITLVA